MAFNASSSRAKVSLASGLRRLGIWMAMIFLAPSCASAMDSQVNGVAGRYAILRADDKDTGCMLTLETSARAGGSKALLAPACRDNGMVIFDPVAWSLERGRLALTARKGHKNSF